MKKTLAIVLALVMVLALAACGTKAPAATQAPTGAPETTAPETTAPESAYKVAMITDYGDITDQSFNQTTYEACKAFCDANSIDFSYYKPAGDSTPERVAMVDAAVADGYNVLVMPGFAFAGTVVETAELYPDVKFIALDVAEYDLQDAAGTVDTWSYVVPSNVFCAVYQEELCGYMAGYAAVKMGYKHLGFCGGMAVPAVVRYGYGFAQGCDAAAAELGLTDVVVEYAYANQFFGDADITAYMDTWYQTKGVEVVFACGGGVFTSVAEAAAKTGAKVIGVDTDQSGVIDGAYGEGMTVTSAMKGLAATVDTLLTATVLNDDFATYGGQVQTLGLISADAQANYVQIPYETTQWNDTFTQADYEALVAAMFDGTVTVSNDTENAPAVTAIALNEYGNIK